MTEEREESNIPFRVFTTFHIEYKKQFAQEEDISLDAAPEFPQNIPDTPTSQDTPDIANPPQMILRENPLFDCRILTRELEIPGIISSVEKNKSILSWDALPKAQAYRVYKADAGGNMMFLAEVTEPRYEILFSSSELAFEEFGVKAIVYNEACDLDTTGYSVTSIQTGTSELIQILLTLFGTVLIYGLGFGMTRKIFR